MNLGPNSLIPQWSVVWEQEHGTRLSNLKLILKFALQLWRKLNFSLKLQDKFENGKPRSEGTSCPTR